MYHLSQLLHIQNLFTNELKSWDLTDLKRGVGELSPVFVERKPRDVTGINRVNAGLAADRYLKGQLQKPCEGWISHRRAHSNEKDSTLRATRG